MKLIGALTVAVLLLLAWTTPAAASPSSLPDSTNWLPCPSDGELLGLTRVEERYRVDYAIEFTSCESWVEPSYYAIAYFGSDGIGMGDTLRAAGSGVFSTVVRTAPVSAICLMAAPDSHIACREVVYAAGSATLGAVPPESLVSGPVYLTSPALGPTCPSCW